MDKYSPEGGEPHDFEDVTSDDAYDDTVHADTEVMGDMLSKEQAGGAEPCDVTERDMAVSGAFEAVEAARELPRIVGLLPDNGPEEAVAYAAQDEVLASVGLGIEARYPDTDMRVKEGDTGPQPTMHDPEIFAGALADVTTESNAAEHIKAEGSGIVRRSLDRASTVLYRAYYPTVVQPFPRGRCRNPDIRPDIVQAPEEPDAAQLAFVHNLGASAASLRTDLERLGAGAPTVAALESLAIASEEGMVVDWARMYVTRLVGHDDNSIRGRFHSSADWGAIESSLADLQSRAPDARFTQFVHDTLRTDVNASIADLVDGAREYVDPHIPETSLRWQYAETAFMHRMPSALAEYTEFMPGLRRALEVMDRVWPARQG